MRPSSKGTYGGWLLFDKVKLDTRLTLGDIWIWHWKINIVTK